MLLFINEIHYGFVAQEVFQYISCYSLSNGKKVADLINEAFQYISCYSLSSASFHINLESSCFNTSHVTLYQEEREIREDKEEVSIHLMLLFIGYKIGNYCFFRLFQYISCYSLSQFLHTFEQINWKFQYISCYSLSWILSYEGRKVLGFNTSHVTLYQKMFEKEIDEI